MTHPVWPFFDLRVVTPTLELVPIDDEVGADLALVACRCLPPPISRPD